MFPRDLSNRAFIGFAQDQDHLFFGKSNLLHQLLALSVGAIVSSYDWAEKPGQVIEAESHEAAARPFEGHPHLQIPQSSIEVMEINPLHGM